MIRKCIFLLPLFFSLFVSAQNSIVWNGKNDKRDIGDKILFFEDKGKRYSVDEVSSSAFDSKFVLSSQKVFNHSDTSFYWVKLSIINNTDDKLLLEIPQPVLSEVDFFYRDSLTGKWHTMHAGFKVPLSQKFYRHQYQLFPLTKSTQEYYLRLQSKGIAIPMRIWEESLYEENSSNQKIIFGIFTGLMGFVVLINLFFFFSLRKFPHLHYAVLVLLYYLIAANVEGYIVYVFPGLDLFYGMFIYAIINMPIGISFAMLFLDTKNATPKLNKIGWILFFYYVSYIFWHRFLSPMYLAYVSNFHGLLVVLIMAAFGIQVGRNGNKMGYYFFVSYMLFFVFAAIDTKSKLTGSPPYIFELSYVSIGFLIEALSLSYLLTVRFDWEKKSLEQERLKAQSLLLEQTRENERIIKEQNILLEHKVAERTNELIIEKKKAEEALSQLQSTQSQLIQKEKLASLGELTAGIAHEIQNPLNFVNNFSELSVELAKELKEERLKGKEERDEALENELVEDLIQNQEKINLHGKRASSIVKGMLEHSRTATGERQLTDINQLADEYLRLSYHGLRAKNSSFNADYELIEDKTLAKVEVVPQEIGRVLLNIINNAFYAVHERAKPGKIPYQPKVTVITKVVDNYLELRVQDNGTGIPEAIKSKIFQPFFTTKPTGEGTGLGLSLSYDIVVKGHGGTLEAESEEGEGTTFILRLPLSGNVPEGVAG